MLDLHPHLTHSFERMETIFSFKKIFIGTLTLRQSSKKDRAVRNGFIARGGVVAEETAGPWERK
jgi:hypothetical protein